MDAVFSSGVDYVDGNAMGYATPGAYCVKGKPKAPKANIVPIYAPGIFGGIPKNYAGGSCEVDLEVCYIAGSEAECLESGTADAEKLGKDTSDLTLGSKDYKVCRLVRFDQEQPRNTGRGTWRMDVVITVDSMNPWST